MNKKTTSIIFYLAYLQLLILNVGYAQGELLIDVAALLDRNQEDAVASCYSSICNSLYSYRQDSLKITDPYLIKQGDYMGQIIRENYNLPVIAGSYYDPYEEISSLILLENPDIGSLDSIYLGQELNLPVLPKFPSRIYGEDSLTQVINLNSWDVFLSGTSDDFRLNFPLEQGNSWSITGTSAAIDSVLNRLSEEEREQIKEASEYIEKEPLTLQYLATPFSSLASPNYSNTENEAPIFSLLKNQISSELLQKLSKLDTSIIGNLYILDQFGHPCSHGNKIKNIIESTLDFFQVQQFKSKIKYIELNANFNKKNIENEVRQYLINRKHKPGYINRVMAELRTHNRSISETDFKVSNLYLKALIYNKIIPSAKLNVISFSFHFFSPERAFFPDKYHQNNRNIMLAAVANDNISFDRDRNFQKHHPQRAFYDRERKYHGLLLISAHDLAYKEIGMFSDDDEQLCVHSLSFGCGWSRECIESDCSDEDFRGTSFATPFIALQIFLAEAFWEKGNSNFSPKEVKRRLLLSSDIKPSFIGKYASGGPPILNHLLVEKGTYVTLADGKFKKVSIDGNSKITFKSKDDPDGNGRFGNNRISSIDGIFCRDGNIYIYQRRDWQWKKVYLEKMEIIVDGVQYDKDSFFKSFNKILNYE